MVKNKLVQLALAFSVVALVVSLYATITSAKFHEEESFNAKVEEGIDAYVKKQQQGNTPPPAPTEPIDVEIGGNAVKGDADAPVTIIEFSDFECPFCGRHFTQTMPDIEENYIKTGKVKYVFRDFPLSFHQNAIPASIASECVREQGGDDVYWDYHDKLFENQKALDSDSLKQYATDIGYDIADCLDSEKYADEVDADFKAGQAAGVRGTPAFFINGKFLSGAQPFSAFEAVIEAELSK